MPGVVGGVPLVMVLLAGCGGASDGEAEEALAEARALASQAAEDRAAAESAAAAAASAAAAAPEAADLPEVTEPPSATAPESVGPQETPPPGEADDADGQAVVTFDMPDLRGVDLQSAQDAIQELGVFFTTSTDLRGSRLQVLDSNWRVCSSQPAPGVSVSGVEGDLEGTIDFGVVRREETCP